MSKVLKSFKGSRTPGFKGSRGSRVNYEVQGFQKVTEVDGSKFFSNPRASGLQRSKGFRACREPSLV